MVAPLARAWGPSARRLSGAGRRVSSHGRPGSVSLRDIPGRRRYNRDQSTRVIPKGMAEGSISMRRRILQWSIWWVAIGASPLGAAEAVLVVSDPQGAAARVGSPVAVETPGPLFSGRDATTGWRLEELVETGDGASVPVQFEPAGAGESGGRLWWLMPSGRAGTRRFRLVPDGASRTVEARYDHQRQCVELREGDRPVLRYNHGVVPVPPGTRAHFAPGESYARGDYIHPVYGPDGEPLTDDFPQDHPHHRGLWWSWPVTRWKDQVADIWAVVGVWARPAGTPHLESGPVYAEVAARNVWKFGKSEVPIVREQVWIRAFAQGDAGRFIDVKIQLTALVDGVAIGGRPGHGYGGFALRAASCDQRQITVHTDPPDATPRRSWLDYSGRFPGGRGLAGLAIFEHVRNPDYPSPLHEYGHCNCVMPAYPDKREVPLSKDKPLVLRYRVWVHRGGPEAARLADVWTAWAEPPQVRWVQ
ncbi:MAG TPA: hypothetical protein EYP56_16830 [Planctomycetaceae bacterium]|nr:hypothetical protein [Planctomycetaceae bacterium]